MYVYDINAENNSLSVSYKSLFVFSETTSGVVINQIKYTPIQFLEINNLITFNTEPKFILPVSI